MSKGSKNTDSDRPAPDELRPFLDEQADLLASDHLKRRSEHTLIRSYTDEECKE
jgi:hypothetical protein